MRYLLVIALLFAFPAFSAPPDNANPALKPWFESLKDKNGIGCCSISDCRRVTARLDPEPDELNKENGWQVHLGGDWIKVPDEIVQHRDNPTGSAVLCFSNKRAFEPNGPTNSFNFYCFVPGSET